MKTAGNEQGGGFAVINAGSRCRQPPQAAFPHALAPAAAGDLSIADGHSGDCRSALAGERALWSS